MCDEYKLSCEWIVEGLLDPGVRHSNKVCWMFGDQVLGFCNHNVSGLELQDARKASTECTLEKPSRVHSARNTLGLFAGTASPEFKIVFAAINQRGFPYS
jgi:hypothetical protein